MKKTARKRNERHLAAERRRHREPNAQKCSRKSETTDKNSSPAGLCTKKSEALLGSEVDKTRSSASDVVENYLNQTGRLTSLKSLLCAGCNRRHLLNLAKAYIEDKWESIADELEAADYGRRKMRSLAKVLLRCAVDIETLNALPREKNAIEIIGEYGISDEAAAVLKQTTQTYDHATLAAEFSRLPMLLRVYATLLPNWPHSAQYRKATSERQMGNATWLVLLIEYVTQKTGQPHFTKIADLIEAVAYACGRKIESLKVDPQQLANAYSRYKKRNPELYDALLAESLPR